MIKALRDVMVFGTRSSITLRDMIAPKLYRTFLGRPFLIKALRPPGVSYEL